MNKDVTATYLGVHGALANIPKKIYPSQEEPLV